MYRCMYTHTHTHEGESESESESEREGVEGGGTDLNYANHDIIGNKPSLTTNKRSLSLSVQRKCCLTLGTLT